MRCELTDDEWTAIKPNAAEQAARIFPYAFGANRQIKDDAAHRWVFSQDRDHDRETLPSLNTFACSLDLPISQKASGPPPANPKLASMRLIHPDLS